MRHMGSKKIEVSGLGHVASKNIRALLGIRRMSNRELARQMERSESYVRARVNDEKEWALNDIEIICRIWHLQPFQMVIEGGATMPAAERSSLEETAACERSDIEAALRTLETDPMSLAAYENHTSMTPTPTTSHEGRRTIAGSGS